MWEIMAAKRKGYSVQGWVDKRLARRTSIVLRPLVVMASLRQALGARLTGLSLPEPFPLSGDSNPESMEDSDPLELRPRASGSSIGEV